MKADASLGAHLQHGALTAEALHRPNHAGSGVWLQAGWGDDTADAGPLNPHYNPERCAHLSVSARRNLARLDENRIDYDLLEELIAHIDAAHEEGAILVFLPGAAAAERLSPCT